MSVNAVQQLNQGPARRLDFSDSLDIREHLKINPETLNRMEPIISDSLRSTLQAHLNPPTDPLPLVASVLTPTPQLEVVPAYVKRDRTYCKNYFLGLSFIPIIGTIPSIISQCILKGKLKKATESEDMIKIITRINQFKIASIVRSLLTLAAAISVLAFGIFTGGIALALGLGLVAAASVLGLGLAAYHGIQYQTNKQEIKELLNTPKVSVEETTPTAQT